MATAGGDSDGETSRVTESGSERRWQHCAEDDQESGVVLSCEIELELSDGRDTDSGLSTTDRSCWELTEDGEKERERLGLTEDEKEREHVGLTVDEKGGERVGVRLVERRDSRQLRRDRVAALTEKSRNAEVMHKALSDAGVYSYAAICALLLNQLFHNKWDLKFSRQTMKTLLAHLLLPKQVHAVMTSLLEGEGSQTPEAYVALLETEPKLAGRTVLIVQDLILLAVKEGQYDARMRVLIKRVAELLDVPAEVVDFYEESFVEFLVKEREMTEAEKAAGAQRQRSKRFKRYALIGLATVGGGTLIGLTGGLAAPLIGAGVATVLGGAGMAALTSTASIAIIGSLFGVAGAGLSGFKMNKRVGDIEEFSFSYLNAGGEEGGAEEGGTIEESSDSNGKEDTGKTDHGEDKNGKGDTGKLETGKVYVGKGETGKAESAKGKTSKKDSGKTDSGKKDTVNKEPGKTDSGKTDSAEDELTPAVSEQLHIVIAISGWLSDDRPDNFSRPWRCLDASREQYCLRYESRYLLELGRALDMVLTVAVSVATQQALKLTILQGLLAAIAWPANLLGLASLIDNPWGVSCRRSSEAGKQLADVLMSREQGQRPVTLVGFSLGARVIFYCLREMSTRTGCEGIVQDAVMLGAPVTGQAADWEKLTRVVAGRIVNGYCRSDWLLKFLYRKLSVTSEVAGLQPVALVDRRMCNVDLGEVIQGHGDYPDNLDLVLRLVGVQTCSLRRRSDANTMRKSVSELPRSLSQSHINTSLLSLRPSMSESNLRLHVAANPILEQDATATTTTTTITTTTTATTATTTTATTTTTTTTTATTTTATPSVDEQDLTSSTLSTSSSMQDFDEEATTQTTIISTPIGLSTPISIVVSDASAK